MIASGRAKRPHAVQRKAVDAEYRKREGCPFENLRAAGGKPPILAYDRRGKKLGKRYLRQWFVQVVPNKYPAFAPGLPRLRRVNSLQETLTGAGFHELVIWRDHDHHWATLDRNEAAAVFQAYQERYNMLTAEPIVRYVSIFHNYGREAGASIYHPHSQILAIPVIPPDVQRSFGGSMGYFHSHGRCVHCDLIAFERKKRTRVVLENTQFIAFCPFASRISFEIRLFPKRHEPCFGSMTDRELRAGGDLLRQVMKRLHRTLDDPPYNFFIHTSPCGPSTAFSYYHWHLEIIPKMSIGAGFEIGTGIDIATVSPEKAAAQLRRV